MGSETKPWRLRAIATNGIGPSEHAVSPQSTYCANCPHGAWGSKVTETGSSVKACGDHKKLAVVIAADTPIVSATGAAGVAKAFETVYEFRVPPTGLRPMADMVKFIASKGQPLISVVLRATFDPANSFPSPRFTPIQVYGNKEIDTLRMLVDKAKSKEAREAVGADDKPKAANGAAAPTSERLASADSTPASIHFHGEEIVQQAQPPLSPASEPPKRRGRRTNAEIEADRLAAQAAAQQGGTQAVANGQMLQTPAATSANSVFPSDALVPRHEPQVIQTPQASSPELDNLLAGLFGGPK